MTDYKSPDVTLPMALALALPLALTDNNVLQTLPIVVCLSWSSAAHTRND